MYVAMWSHLGRDVLAFDTQSRHWHLLEPHTSCCPLGVRILFDQQTHHIITVEYEHLQSSRNPCQAAWPAKRFRMVADPHCMTDMNRLHVHGA